LLAQIAFVQMLTNAVPSQFVEGQARASQHYWQQVLNYSAQGTASPYNVGGSSSVLGFQWLETTDSVNYWTSRFQGMVGVSAGMRPNANFETGTNGDTYRANGLEMDEALASGGSNPDFIFHVPSAYSFEPELPGLRDTLIRMWDQGVAMWPMAVNMRVNNAYNVGGSGGTCSCPNGEVYQGQHDSSKSNALGDAYLVLLMCFNFNVSSAAQSETRTTIAGVSHVILARPALAAPIILEALGSVSSAIQRQW
jgi:hypothetical protein